MSYQSKKRKTKLNKLKFFIGLVWARFFNKFKKRKEKKMQLFGVKKVMEFIRTRSKIIRPNNLRINEWVDDYLIKCLANGESVNVLTPWSLSKALEKRFIKQGGKFIPTKKEIRLFSEELPQIIGKFKENGFRLNWWITLSRSYLDSRLIPKELESEYQNMVTELATRFSVNENVLVLNWEDDLLYGRSTPDKRVLEDFDEYVKQGVFEVELDRWRDWVKNEAGLNYTEKDLESDTKYQIACEVNEGKFLMGDESPFSSGEFIIIPLEMPERFDNFTIFAPELKKRIVSILSYYPWRLSQ